MVEAEVEVPEISGEILEIFGRHSWMFRGTAESAFIFLRIPGIPTKTAWIPLNIHQLKMAPVFSIG